MTTARPRIQGVTVLYHPEPEVVERLVKLAAGLDRLIVVSNGANPEILDRCRREARVQLIENNVNVGLGRALNQGIAAALADPQTDFVWLLDQDSGATTDTAYSLSDAFLEAMAERRRPACVGPLLIDDRTEAAMTRLRGSKRLFSVPTIATSGSLISREALEAVGLMLDELFIDAIDHEWCFRARAQGCEIFIDRASPMRHHMGELTVSVRGLTRPMYRSPVRHYFIVRNTVSLLRRSYVPLRWRLAESAKLLRRLVLYTAKSHDSRRSAKLMIRALGDGWRGRLGPLVE